MPYKDPETRKRKHREYMLSWYRNNRKRHIASAAKGKLRLQQSIKDYKAASSCFVCGESDPACLDYHHEGGKDFCIAEALKRGYGLRKIMREVEKCIVLCANCHRKHHAKQSGAATGKMKRCDMPLFAEAR